MTLRQARCAFTVCVADLILYAVSKGYELALDEGKDTRTWIDPTTDHMPGSLHEVGLAQDINLYKQDDSGRVVYLTNSLDYLPLGEHWEYLGKKKGLPLAWGGRFKNPDGNHFSFAWQGRK